MIIALTIGVGVMNCYLISMYQQTGRLMQRFRLFGFRNPDVVRRAAREHIEFVDAMLVRDVEGAKETLRHHIGSSKLCVLEMLKTS